MKEINDDSNNNDDHTNANDPFTGFTIHGYKNSRTNFQNLNKSKSKKAIRNDHFICFFNLFGVWFF